MMILFVIVFTTVTMLLLMSMVYGGATLADRAEAKKFREVKEEEETEEVLHVPETLEQFDYRRQQQWEREFAEATGTFEPMLFIENQIAAQLRGDLSPDGYLELVRPFISPDEADENLLRAEKALFHNAYQQIGFEEGEIHIDPPQSLPQTTTPLLKGESDFLQRHLLVLNEMQKRNPEKYASFEWRKKTVTSALNHTYNAAKDEYREKDREELMLADRALELGSREVKSILNRTPSNDPRALDLLAKHHDFTRRRQIIAQLQQ